MKSAVTVFVAAAIFGLGVRDATAGRWHHHSHYGRGSDVALGVTAGLLGGALLLGAAQAAPEPVLVTPQYAYPDPYSPYPSAAEIDGAWAAGYEQGVDAGRQAERARPLGLADGISSGLVPVQTRAADPFRR